MFFGLKCQFWDVQPVPLAVFLQEDSYGQYDPRYRHYDSSGSAYGEPGGYRYPEPERPSSRASHCSDRPASRCVIPTPKQRGCWRLVKFYSVIHGQEFKTSLCAAVGVDGIRWHVWKGYNSPAFSLARALLFLSCSSLGVVGVCARHKEQ